MSGHFNSYPLRPRRDGVLRVLMIARISTEHQDLKSLDDQVALCRRYVEDHYQGETDARVIQGRGSGESLDRQDFLDALEAAESGRYDLIITEDLGRICRRMKATEFCEACQDSDTRLIAINDGIDTVNDDWRLNALFASFKHESSNKDTSQRIRRTLRNRFEQGGVVQTLPYGYVKRPGSSNDADVTKLPEAQHVYEQIFTMLENNASYSEVADWLNANGVPIGKWVRSQKWNCGMVARVVHNPILKGYRRRNERMSKRVNRTGRRKSVKAPEAERLYRFVNHLAFIDQDRYDRLIDKLEAKNAMYARGRLAKQADSRAGVSRKRTVWPGQHMQCGICGRLMYWGGHGMKDHMMCAGSRDYACWNGATCDGLLAGRKILAAVLAYIEQWPGFDAAFQQAVTEALTRQYSGQAERRQACDQQLRTLDLEISRVTDAIAKIGDSESLLTKLRELETKRRELRAERGELDQVSEPTISLPSSDELRALARQRVAEAEVADAPTQRFLRELLPVIQVFPCRLLDGKQIVLRAKVTLSLAPLLAWPRGLTVDAVTAELGVDLFEPPQREAFRQQVVTMREAGQTERQIATTLGITITAAQQCMVLHRRMQELGRTDAYEYLTEPVTGKHRHTRHLHMRYAFQPLPNYPAQPPVVT